MQGANDSGRGRRHGVSPLMQHTGISSLRRDHIPIDTGTQDSPQTIACASIAGRPGLAVPLQGVEAQTCPRQTCSSWSA
ncbi:hypothetical protein PsYK624_155780 [Phanerochaete sordida]|uniref:Uncharacterized protein n=1 Tax=Phanerochaete sordida TaxID=48140 RepID=A0A9P3LM37_9APHY|nr:hypothetical protein PsYK624_155780 [Phanerochaete sordida]